ncbi:MAG TPA: glycosyltransferase, partial [Solirubrobacteraceae bacterium]|nr:glycosyltransferase [Solirubrobacteraceae bacterium]
LLWLLNALADQTFDRPWEVVVVHDYDAATAARIFDDHPLAHDGILRHLPIGPGTGASQKRNLGWREARAPLVAFTDDDCTPAPGWLEGLLAAAGERVVVQGRIAPRPDQRGALGPLSHTLDVRGPNRLFFTANIAYPRELLAELDGFDEWFRRACGEDVELGARATKAGADVRFVPDALVHHEVRALTLREHLRQTAKWSDAARALRLHPEWRSELVASVFWKPSHPRLLLAAAGLVTRRPVLGLPYLLHLRRLYGGDLRAAARAAPVHLVVDAAEVATMAVASARHRTLIL